MIAARACGGVSGLHVVGAPSETAIAPPDSARVELSRLSTNYCFPMMRTQRRG